MRIEKLIEDLKEFVVRGDGGQDKILQKNDFFCFRLYNEKLKVPRSNIEQQMVLMNKFFIKKFILYSSYKFILQRGSLQFYSQLPVVFTSTREPNPNGWRILASLLAFLSGLIGAGSRTS